ncbi:MAG: hypothetical protein WAT51_02510, partial [Holophaga sp.]
MSGEEAASLPLKYLDGYSATVQEQVRELMAQNRLGEYLQRRYAEAHEVRNDKALLQAALELKNRYLRSTPPLAKVMYDGRLQVLSHALGT